MDLVIIAVTTITLTAMSMGYSLLKRRLEHRSTARPELDSVERRLERIEQAVDTIAIEVERVSEGQRYTTRLLADRAGAREATPTADR